MACKFYLLKGMGRKAEGGHLWIYSNEIEGYDGEYANGDIVEVYNFRKTVYRQGLYQ